MRISDWSSDVCSSDLVERLLHVLVDLEFDEGFRKAIGYRRGHMARARNVRGRILDLARDLGLQLRGCRARQLHVDDEAGEVEVRHLGDLQRVKAEKAGDRKSTRLNSSH